MSNVFEGDSPDCIAFAGSRRIAAGPLADVALAVKRVVDTDDTAAVMVFEAKTSRPVEIDTRGTPADVIGRIAPEDTPAPRKPGRPRLGVVGREVTLLPRHWDWLNAQPGGASVALRKLVDQARKANEDQDRQRAARNVCYRFMSAMGGDLPNFEEASRALFAGDSDRFDEMVDFWPEDIRDHTRSLAAAAFGPVPA